MITDDLGLVFLVFCLMFLVIHIGRKTGRYVVSQQTNAITNCSNFSYKVGFYFENLALRDLACSFTLGQTRRESPVTDRR